SGLLLSCFMIFSSSMAMGSRRPHAVRARQSANEGLRLPYKNGLNIVQRYKLMNIVLRHKAAARAPVVEISLEVQADMARKTKSARAPQLQTADFVRLASFRYALRRFLRFSEAAAVKVGLTGQHYQAMLA